MISVGGRGDQRFWVSASNPDSVDFVAAALIAAACPHADVEIHIDESLEFETTAAASRFDPRLALPLPSLAMSPDGSARQEMIPLGSFERSRVPGFDPPNPVPELEIAFIQESRTHRHGASPTCALIEHCLQRLRLPNVRVVRRIDRRLGPVDAQRAVGALRAHILHFDIEEGRFAQGGAISMPKLSRRAFTRYRVRDDAVSVMDRFENETFDLTPAGADAISFRGPLDILSWPTNRQVLSGHVPWYFAASPRGSDQADRQLGPAGVEVVQSLFLRDSTRSFERKATGFTGVLVDEYDDDGLRRYMLDAVGSDAGWLCELARALAGAGVSSRERWAWSQACASSMVHSIRNGSTGRLGDSPFWELVTFSRERERAARDKFNSRETVSAGYLAQLGEIIVDWKVRLESWGVPDDFSSRDGLCFQSLERQSERLRAAPNEGRALAGAKIQAWRLVELVLRGVLLVVDTKLRASLPVLALYSSDPTVVLRAANRHSDLIQDRIQSPFVLRLV